jgi:hypothetical protein
MSKTLHYMKWCNWNRFSNAFYYPLKNPMRQALLSKGGHIPSFKIPSKSKGNFLTVKWHMMFWDFMVLPLFQSDEMGGGTEFCVRATVSKVTQDFWHALSSAVSDRFVKEVKLWLFMLPWHLGLASELANLFSIYNIYPAFINRRPHFF